MLEHAGICGTMLDHLRGMRGKIGRSRMTDRCTIQKSGLLCVNWGVTPTITASSSSPSAKFGHHSPITITNHPRSSTARLSSKIINNHLITMMLHRLPRLRTPPTIHPTRSLHLTPRETDHLLLHNAGRLAQYRLARGLKLNVPESRALIAMQMMEMIRNGVSRTVDARGDRKRDGSISSLMSLGSRLLGRNQVMEHVPSLVKEVQIEGTFRDGTKLLTIHNPIGGEDGDLELALEGSFLPVPDLGVFKSAEVEGEKVKDGVMCPGQVLVSQSLGDIEINVDRELIEIPVTNTGDRPIQ
jgi:urease gamma subunit